MRTDQQLITLISPVSVNCSLRDSDSCQQSTMGNKNSILHHLSVVPPPPALFPSPYHLSLLLQVCSDLSMTSSRRACVFVVAGLSRTAHRGSTEAPDRRKGSDAWQWKALSGEQISDTPAGSVSHICILEEMKQEGETCHSRVTLFAVQCSVSCGLLEGAIVCPVQTQTEE